MEATCPRCGLTATFIPDARDSYRTRRPDRFSVDCPVIAEKATARGGTLSAAQIVCEHLDAAVLAAFNDWRQGL